MIERLELSTSIKAPRERCFDLSRDIDVHMGSMATSRERAVGGVTSGLIGLGEEVTWTARHFGIQWRMTSRLTQFDRPLHFVDEMQRGPFRSFRHAHCFEQREDVTTMVDVIDYRLPFGLIGTLADAAVVRRYLRSLLETRNRYIKELAEADSS